MSQMVWHGPVWVIFYLLKSVYKIITINIFFKLVYFKNMLLFLNKCLRQKFLAWYVTCQNYLFFLL